LKEFFDGILYLVITIGIFVLTYYSTRFISKRSLEASKTRNMKLIEKVSVGKDKEVALMKVGDQFFLVGIAPNAVSISTPLTQEAADAIDESAHPMPYATTALTGIFASYRMQAWTLKLSEWIRKILGKDKERL
jgi:flagellar biogenesis protein FliO